MPAVKQLKLKEINVVYFLCLAALVLFYISDSANKILQYSAYTAGESEQELKSISIYVRATFEIFFLLVSLIFFNRKRLNYFILMVLLFIVFIIGQGIYYLNFNYEYNVNYNISAFNKYIFIFLMYCGIYNIVNDREKLNRLISILENIFLLNSIFIFVGLIFNFGLFKSYYSYNYRYGYNGLIPAINEASLFYIIAVSHFYYKRYILKEKSYNLYLVLAASCLLGSKAILLFNLGLLLYHLFSIANRRQIINSLFVLSGIVSFIFILISSQLGKKLLGFFYHSTEKYGILSMFLSGRDLYVKTKFFENIKSWKLVNYFLGGQDQSRFLIEMDIFDIFLFFGIIGSTIYFYLLFKSIFNFKFYLKFTYFFIISYLFIAFLGGHFFASAVNSLYLILFCFYQQSQNHYVVDSVAVMSK